MGHKKADYPRLSGEAKRAPNLATLRITDGQEGKVEVHVVKGITFQLTVEEARAALDVVTGMCLIMYFLLFPFFMLMFHMIMNMHVFS